MPGDKPKTLAEKRYEASLAAYKKHGPAGMQNMERVEAEKYGESEQMAGGKYDPTVGVDQTIIPLPKEERRAKHISALKALEED